MGGAHPVHFELYSNDPEASARFCAEAFDWKIDRWGEDPYWLVDTGGAPGINGAVAPAGEEGAHTLNTLEVEDLEGAMDRAVAAGGTILGDIMPIPGVGRWVRLRDPGGVLIGLLEPAGE